MNDDLVSRAAVVSLMLWAAAASCVIVTWMLALYGAPLRYEGAVGLTAVASLSVAAVWQIRLYMLRLSALIRVTSGLDGQTAELHAFGRSKGSV